MSYPDRAGRLREPSDVMGPMVDGRAKGGVAVEDLGRRAEVEPGNLPAPFMVGMPKVSSQCSEEVEGEQWSRQETTTTGLELEVVVEEGR